MTLKNKNFTAIKIQFFKKDLDIDNILIYGRVSFRDKNYKYFIGYMDDNYKIKRLRIMFWKTNVYVKTYDGKTKWIYFSIEDDKLLTKYDDIWNKINHTIEKEFDNEPICNKKFWIPKLDLIVMRLQIFMMKNCLK